MFWGLVLEPGKKYKQVVEKSFHISMACLQPNKSPSSDYVSFVLHNKNQDFILCSLNTDDFLQTQLDLNFAAGDEITFETRGAKNNIHLSGYVIEDEEDDFDNMEELNGMEESEDEEVTDLVPVKKMDVKRKAPLEPLTINTKKAKQALITEVDTSDDDDDEDEEEEDVDSDLNEVEDEEEDEEEEDDDDDSMESDESPAKPLNVKLNRTPEQQKKKNQPKSPATPTAQINGKTPTAGKKNKGQETPTTNNTPKAAKTPNTPAAGAPKKSVLEGGIISEDLKVGQGQFAKSGKMVSVFYSGRLKTNGKQFDSCTQGNGFKFRLGKGEVIKGWDIGVSGMKVGGKRRITIPAALAYGAKGSMPQIPPNSTLVFEVELKNVN